MLLLFNGCPLKPPVSLVNFFLDFKLFLLIVVLDVIIPSILRSSAMSTRSLMSSSIKSGEILIKISPDLIDDDIKDLVDMALDLKIDGIITSNTTIKRNNLKSKKKLTNETGGLSGQPLNNRSTDIIRLIHEYSNKKLPIIGVGGIMTTQDALDKINAGASLIQLYTGFIYNGPSFARNINKEIIKSLN